MIKEKLTVSENDNLKYLSQTDEPDYYKYMIYEDHDTHEVYVNKKILISERGV